MIFDEFYQYFNLKKYCEFTIIFIRNLELNY